MDGLRMVGNTPSSFRGKIAAQARRDTDRLHGHFAMNATVLAGERIEFRVEVITPVDGLEAGLEELCRRDVIAAFKRKLRRAWPHHEIRLVDDLDC
jgi:hypothetical protein